MNFEMVFVSHTGRHSRPYYDPSVRYRTYHLAEHFRRKGKIVTLVSQKVFEEYTESFADAKLILFHRPSLNDSMIKYVLRNGERQSLVADYDDLVFDVTSTGSTPAVVDRGDDFTQTARYLASNAEMGSMFQLRTASTVPLAVEAQDVMGGETTVIHNGLDPVYLDVAQRIYKSRKSRKPDFGIGYFSGTASHNSDLQMIAPQIADYLKEDEEQHMLLVGPVQLPQELEPYKDRIVRERVKSFHTMPNLIANCRMVQGPLLPNRFTRCKSGLKFFEAGVLGVSVAASPIPDIDRFESPLLHKCVTPEDWAIALRAPAPQMAALNAAVRRLRNEASLTHQTTVWEKTFLEAS